MEDPLGAGEAQKMGHGEHDECGSCVEGSEHLGELIALLRLLLGLLQAFISGRAGGV